LKELKTLEKASLVDEARSMLNKLLTAQEYQRKEKEEQMAEEARHLHNFQASYQRLVDDSRESKVVTKNTEQVITTTWATISKAQALIQVNEQKLVDAKKRLEELKAAKKLVKKILLPILPSWSLFKHSWL